MWIKRLAIKNVGPHTDLDLELPRGLIGVFGPNGSGKSAILNLAFAGITNDFSRFDGVKADCVYDLAEPDAESSITLECEHNGQEFWVKRKLRGRPAHELVVAGERSITDERKITERLTALLDADRAIMDLFVFKEQNQIFDYLVVTDAQRKQAFQKLCKTGDCAAIHDLLGNFLNKDTELNAIIEDNSDELVAAIAEQEDRNNVIQTQIDEYSRLLLNSVSLASARDIVRRREHCQHITADIEHAQHDRRVHAQALDEAQQSARKAKNKLTALTKFVRSSKADADRAAETVRIWKTYNPVECRRAALQEEIDSLNRAWDRAEAPEDTVKNLTEDILTGKFDVDAASETLTRYSDQVSAAEHIVQTFDATGVTQCPTCMTPVEHLHDHIEAMRDVLKTIPEKRDRLRRKIRRAKEYIQARRIYETNERAYRAGLKSTESSLAALEVIDRPEMSLAEAAKIVNQYQDNQQQLDQCKNSLDRATTLVTQKQATLDACIKSIARLEEQLEESCVPDEKFDRAQKRLKEHDAASLFIAKLEGEQAGVVAAIDKSREELKRLRARIKRNKVYKKMARIITRAREVMHRDNLPSRVAHKTLARLEGAINRDLGLFGDPFWVETNEDLTFTIHKPGHPPESSGRLSIGQKVILSIPFWFAWRSEIGLLCLDEPTANLDIENQLFLTEALGKLAATVRGSRQVIIVTHSDALRPVFDAVVELHK